jgi:FkbM family methyltransferase
VNGEILISYEEKESILTTKIDFLSEKLNYPLSVYFAVSNKIIWKETIRTSNTWCSLPSSRGLDVRVLDNKGDLIFNKFWSPNSKSDTCEIEFIRWCQDFYFNKGYKPRGVVIGSHNGSTGEWVEAFKQNLIGNTLLIEPNILPFNQLVSTYQHDNRFSFKNSVVSEHSGLVDFFTDDSLNSEASSLIKDNLLKNSQTAVVHKVNSTPPIEIFDNFPADWLHIDAEGYDAKILLILSDDHLNKLEFIIWEHIHLDDETKIKLREKLELSGFSVTPGLEYNTFATKKEDKKRNIVIKLMGGLGNQMFQYAFGKYISNKTGRKLILDTSFLDDRDKGPGFVYRNYDLDVFDIDVDVVSSFDEPYEHIQEDWNLLHVFQSDLVEKIINSTSKNLYVEGYWQSPGYFNNLIDDFKKFKFGIEDNSIGLMNDILNSNSVMINVRRTDFVSNDFLGCFGRDYIEKALKNINGLDYKCFIFSDDPKWCQENLSDLGVIVGHDHKGYKFSNYLQLMSLCKFFIIPNSSFAWWSAYLSNSKTDVYYPEKWINGYPHIIKHLFPEDWISVN